MNQIALIGDLIGSRQVKDRNTLQEKLKDIFKKLNKENKSIVSPYTLTLGDEFQVVYRNGRNVLFDAVQICEKIYPQKIRFSYGIGKITTKINPEQSTGMDGPAFYNARNGMSDLKRRNRDIEFSITGVDSYGHYGKLLVSGLKLFGHQINEYKQNSLQILINLYSGNKPKVIASQIGISIQAVYKFIRLRGFNETAEYIKAFENTLNEFVGGEK